MSDEPTYILPQQSDEKLDLEAAQIKQALVNEGKIEGYMLEGKKRPYSSNQYRKPQYGFQAGFSHLKK